MATLPVVPTFEYQSVPSIAKLNQLAYAVQFATQVPIVVSLKRSSSQSISANTNTAVQWNVSEVDSDGMHSTVTNPSRLVCQTQGYYRLHASLSMNWTTTAEMYRAYFQQTTGVNNPAGSGVTVKFCVDGSVSGTNAADEMSISLSSMTPCLFPGDYVEAYVFCEQAVTLANAYLNRGHLDQAGNADGASCLYAYYVCEGP